MNQSYFTWEQESIDRNQALNQEHGEIPSYCLWRESDIKNESIDQRYKWWDYLKSEKIDNDIKKGWIDYFCNLNFINN